MTSIQSVNSHPSTINSFAYTYNSANQRTRLGREDGTFWIYKYDSLGQVISGKKYWSDFTPVAGQQFEYGFDDIGNRTSTKAGGDENGANLRFAGYYANNLNQNTVHGVPGAFDVIGVGFATNEVTVNGDSTYRHGEYFRKEITVDNGLAPVWQPVTVASPGQSSVTGNEFVPKYLEFFYYDLDGNLTNDGRWTYYWDAENRLVTMAANTSVGPQISLQFEYDSKSRRIRKRVWDNTAWSGSSTNDLQFVYDGWNLIAELSNSHSALRTYTWGLDLSGSLQGAGGVGGLVEVNTTALGFNFVGFDGNGNASCFIKANDGLVSATYEYNPFGEILRSTGPLSGINSFRFSTKYRDDETGLLYYGYRYSTSVTGGWLSRDPIGELGGINVYSNCRNDAENAVDWVGLWRIERNGQARATAFAETGDTIRRLAAIVGLNASEWRRWLRAERVFDKNYDLDTALYGCDQFSVPNTAFVNYDVGFVDFRLALWALTYTHYVRERWNEAGYKVRYYRLVLGRATLLSELSDLDIYKFAYVGHGAVGNLILGVDESEWLGAGKYTPFGINEMQLIACSTDYSWEQWAGNVARPGGLTTVQGDLSISHIDLRNHSGQGN